jgi:hypothetical protein
MTKISKCCGSKAEDIYCMGRWQGYMCPKCNKPCDTIEEVQNEEKTICRVLGCDKPVWKNVCNEYCEKHHNDICIDEEVLLLKPTPTQPEKEWKEEAKKYIYRAYNLSEDNLPQSRKDAEEIVIKNEQFIQSLLSQKDKEVRQDILNKIEFECFEIGYPQKTDGEKIISLEQIKSLLKPTK